MMDSRYIEQVSLLLKLLPAIAKIPDFALHGGTAINLFHHNMPRLSVDIDLTFVPYTDRQSDLNRIHVLLTDLARDLTRKMPALRIEKPVYAGGEYKLFCTLGQSTVKVEVNTIIRGVIAQPEQKVLCERAQKMFDVFVETNIVPESQLFGGKLVAALDRQHPRDLFDTRMLLDRNGLTNEMMIGFLFCLFNSNRPIHETLHPKFNDQTSAIDNQFMGMSVDPFTNELFEKERVRLLNAIHDKLTETHKETILGFVANKPKWFYGDWSNYPGIKWKLQNLSLLEKDNPRKFKEQRDLLKLD